MYYIIIYIYIYYIIIHIYIYVLVLSIIILEYPNLLLVGCPNS